MYKHILIPTDGSELSERAVREGIDLASAMQARVTLLTASMPFHVFATDALMVSDTPQKYADSRELPTYGHDTGGIRHSPLTEITPANVGNLEIAWTYHLKPEGYVPQGGGRGGGRAAAAGEPPAAQAPAGGRGGGRGAGRVPGLQGWQAKPLIITGLVYVASQ